MDGRTAEERDELRRLADADEAASREAGETNPAWSEYLWRRAAHRRALASSRQGDEE